MVVAFAVAFGIGKATGGSGGGGGTAKANADGHQVGELASATVSVEHGRRGRRCRR